MPELHEENKHVLGPPSMTVDGVPESRNGCNDPPQPQESVTSPIDNVSEIPLPFDSESSEDEDDGDYKTNIPSDSRVSLLRKQRGEHPCVTVSKQYCDSKSNIHLAMKIRKLSRLFGHVGILTIK